MSHKIELYRTVQYVEKVIKQRWSFFDGKYEDYEGLDYKNYYIVGFNKENVYLASCFFKGNFSGIISVSKKDLEKFYLIGDGKIEEEYVLSIELPKLETNTWLYLAKQADKKVA